MKPNAEAIQLALQDALMLPEKPRGSSVSTSRTSRAPKPSLHGRLGRRRNEEIDYRKFIIKTVTGVETSPPCAR